MKCLFCNQEIPKNRLYGNTKYCSVLCNKRAWYVKHNPNSNPHYIKNSDFWKTETGIGFKWEIYASKKLGAKHLKFNGSGGDLDWNGKIVDVKSCCLYKRKRKRNMPVKSEQAGIWTFARGKKKKIDYFFCVCLFHNKVHKTLLIPDKDFQEYGIAVGWKSKYDKFLYK